jgi:MFS family permease
MGSVGIGLPRTVLAVPGTTAMVVWSLLGRFGFTMGSLGLLLFVSARSGSYATAGLVSACGLLGTSAGMVVQGRLIDRFGPTRPLLALAAPHAVLAAAAVLGIQAGIPTAAVAVLVAAQCAALPAVTAASRTMWSRLVPTGPARDAAYGYEALSNELCWLLGPAAAGLLATLLWPGTALVAALAMATVAAMGFARTRAVRSHRDPAPAPGHRAPAADSSQRSGLAVLLVAAAGFGLAVGFTAIGVIAGTAAAGVAPLAGILLAVWTTCSVLGGLAHQRWPWPPSAITRLPAFVSALGLLLFIPVLIDGVVALTAMLVLSGLTLVPQLAAHHTLLDGLVPGRRLTEAYGWVTTTIAVTNAVGQAAGGLVIERYDHRTSFLVAALCVLMLAGPVWIRRRRLLGRT